MRGSVQPEHPANRCRSATVVRELVDMPLLVENGEFMLPSKPGQEGEVNKKTLPAQPINTEGLAELACVWKARASSVCNNRDYISNE